MDLCPRRDYWSRCDWSYLPDRSTVGVRTMYGFGPGESVPVGGARKLHVQGGVSLLELWAGGDLVNPTQVRSLPGAETSVRPGVTGRRPSTLGPQRVLAGTETKGTPRPDLWGLHRTLPGRNDMVSGDAVRVEDGRGGGASRGFETPTVSKVRPDCDGRRREVPLEVLSFLRRSARGPFDDGGSVTGPESPLGVV